MSKSRVPYEEKEEMLASKQTATCGSGWLLYRALAWYSQGEKSGQQRLAAGRKNFIFSTVLLTGYGSFRASYFTLFEHNRS